MAVKTSALSSTVRPFRARAARGGAAPLGRLRLPKNYLSVLDFDAAGFAHLMELAARLKSERKLGRRAPTAQALAGQHVALLFDKPSLRTRATFEIAVHALGGDVIVPPQEPFCERLDCGRVRKPNARVSCAGGQHFGQDRVISWPKRRRAARHRALTNEEHPCQAAADLLTLHELGRTRPRSARRISLRRRRQ
jgi:ornithine carbamoyltransferase